MRLIDADKLLAEMSDRYNEKAPIVSNTLAEGFMQMEKLIKEQPTAYSVDKVVSGLFNKAEFYQDENDKLMQVISLNDAIEIVKQEVR